MKLKYPTSFLNLIIEVPTKQFSLIIFCKTDGWLDMAVYRLTTTHYSRKSCLNQKIILLYIQALKLYYLKYPLLFASLGASMVTIGILEK